MKVYLTKDFAQRSRKAGLADADLCQAIDRAEKGKIDALIGSGIIKQRIARKNEGRARGFRAVIFYRRGDLAIFLHFFAKSVKANLSKTEEEEYREFAKYLARLDDKALAALVKEQGWREIDYEQHQEEVSKRRASIAPPGGKRPLRR